MAWDYAYQAKVAGGGFVNLSNYCDNVRIVDEGMGGLRGTNTIIPYLQGARAIGHKFAAESTLLLEVVPRYTDSSGGITDPDGAAGHVYENLSNLKLLFTPNPQGLSTLRRDTPNFGITDIEVEPLAPVRISQAHFIFLFSLNCPHPFWHSSSQNSQSAASPITIGGDGPVDDHWIEFVGGTDASLTHDDTGAQISLSGATPAGGIRVYVGEGRAEYITGGADATSLVSANRSYWMELQAGASNSFTVGGGTTATVKWYDHWRV